MAARWQSRNKVNSISRSVFISIFRFCDWGNAFGFEIRVSRFYVKNSFMEPLSLVYQLDSSCIYWIIIFRSFFPLKHLKMSQNTVLENLRIISRQFQFICKIVSNSYKVLKKSKKNAILWMTSSVQPLQNIALGMKHQVRSKRV